MENAEVIKALRCSGHNTIFHYCDKEDCPYCQYSYHENLHRCNIQKLGVDAADALEAADKRIAIVEEERDLERFAAKNYLDKIDELKAQLPKEGEWRGLIIDGQYWALTCSNCHQVGFNARTPYCPNCGARLWKGEQEKTK